MSEQDETEAGSRRPPLPPVPDPPARRRRIFGLMEVDSWIDTSVWRAGQAFVEFWEHLVVFMRRFRVRGLKRAFVEVVDEAATFGTAGFVLMLAFALPAFEETKKDWRQQADYAVTFEDRWGNEIGKRGVLQDASVPLDEIPDHLVKAALATEDRRFFEHFGIDVIGTFRAVAENMRHRTVVQGGSSISQQLAKNLFLTNERTLERKIKEAFLALWLEANLSKKEILKLYFDRAYMGGGTFGVAAAAQFYFGKSVRDVTLAESAMLAGLFKAPGKYAPHLNLPNAKSRANEVLTNLVQAGFMTEGQVLAARRFPAKPVVRAPSESPDYFLDFAFEEIKQIAPRVHNITVRTTVDMALQKKTEEAVEATLRQFGESYDISQSAVVVSEPAGPLRAMVGGRDYGASQFNRAVAAQRQPGSSFKPYVYAAALVNGFKPEQMVTDMPTCIGDWCPKNYSGGFSGRMSLTLALTKSINTIPVQLTRAIGRDQTADFVRRFGIRLPKKPDWPFVLGSSEVTVYEQVAGYAVFANGGKYLPPYAVEQIRDGVSDAIVWERAKNGTPAKVVMPEDKAAELNAMMQNIVAEGTGKRAQLPGVPAAGKTGTTQSYRDAWFVGYTGNYVAGVWVGNDDYRPMNRVTGGLVPAQTWAEIMKFAHQGIDVKPIFGVPLPPPWGNAGEAVAAAPKPGELQVSERQRALSPQAMRTLTDLGDLFRSAKPLAAQGLSAIPGQTGSVQVVEGQGGGLSAVGRVR